MSDRKQTPDVLGDILGGEPVAPPPSVATKAEPAPAAKPARRKPAAKRSGRQTRSRKPKWEYMEVVFRDYRGYRAHYVNGEEQVGWKDAPPIQEYLNQLGEQGWELVGVGSRHKEEMPAYFKRRK